MFKIIIPEPGKIGINPKYNIPERNILHPQDQIEFVKNLDPEDNLTIFTGSPFIVQAFRYYHHPDTVRYFIQTGEGILKDVTGNLNDVFSSMAGPLRDIMNVDKYHKEKGWI